MALKSITINPGECIVLPSTAVINSVLINGAASASSTCGPLPTPGVYQCGFFALIIDADANTSHPFDGASTYYESITVGTNTYMINELVVTNETPVSPTPIGTLNLHITDLGLFEFKAITTNESPDKRSLIWVFFKTPEALYDTVELKITSFGSAFYLKPYDADCEDYPNPT